MAWSDELGSVLKRYTTGAAVAEPAPDVHEHYDQVAQSVPKGVLAEGLAAAFKSDRTPAFGQMLATLFNNSNSGQKAGLINHLLGSLGPSTLTQIFSGTALAGSIGGQRNITAEQAEHISSNDLQQVATRAEKTDPTIMDSISSFYAQHSDLVKTLGGSALSVALAKVAERQRRPPDSLTA